MLTYQLGPVTFARYTLAINHYNYIEIDNLNFHSNLPGVNELINIAKIYILCCRYTSNHPSIYAIVLKWPSGPVLSLGAPLNTTTTKVSMLGYPGYFKWTARTGGGIDIQLPVIPADKQPTPWHRVLKLDNLLNRWMNAFQHFIAHAPSRIWYSFQGWNAPKPFNRWIQFYLIYIEDKNIARCSLLASYAIGKS